jgi:sugar lactone lactonase YvrE
VCKSFIFAGMIWLAGLSVTAFADEGPFLFRDVAAELGIADATRGMMAHAAAWGDVDGDGQLDLFLGSFADRPLEVYQAGGAKGPVPNVLLMQRKGRFVPADNEAMAWKGRATGSVLADLDNDGWPDLYVSNNGRLGNENLLYRNNRGTLELVTDKAGAPLQLPETSRGVGVFDYDGDGLLDLLVLATVGQGPSLLFHNEGNMQFKPSKALPADLVGLGLAIGDLTGNGWPDVFVGGPNRLFVNQGRGRFREATEFRLDGSFTAEDASPSCGAAMGDFDRDGRLDLVIGSHTKRPWAEPLPLRLFRNLGSTPAKVQLEEVTEQVGLRPLPMKTPHVEIRDFDNDGWPDLYTSIVVFKDGKTYPAIYRNLGAQSARPGDLPRFQETALVHRPEYPEPDDYHPKMTSGAFYDQLVAGRKLMYFAPGPSADFDGDGRLDLMLPSWFSTQSSMLLKNETAGGGYLDVQVVGADGVNRDGIGSMVRAYRPGEALVAGGAGFVASEQIATGYGYASGHVPVAHLGLGELKTCDVVVTLPHGKGQIVRRGVPVNSKLSIDASEAARNESRAALPWPPHLRGATDGTVTIKTDRFLEVPADVAATRNDDGVAPFIMAKEAPTVELAFHDNLGPAAAGRRLWSSWGDICVASDGSVYVGIGDHGNDAGGDARCFIYRWDPAKKTLTQIVDMSQIVPPRPGQPAWSKVHAKIDEGPDGKIYFCCTLNAGNDAGNPKYQWTKELPGAQLYQYDPATGKTIVFASLPPKRCTATSLLDTERNIWWCNLEAGEGDALYGLDLKTKQVVYQSKDGAVSFNRNFALANDGTLHFNGQAGEILRLDSKAKSITKTGVALPDSPGMRASSAESSHGDIFGATHGTGQLFRYRPADRKLKLLGPTWSTGQYTTVMLLSPDERFVYYLPGAHGQAFRYGTPVIQYEIATGTRKVLAFLAPALEEQIDYLPGGTYGAKLSPDGATLYVNFNGHAADPIRPAHMTPIGFGLCSFVAIQIPKSER